MQLTVYGIDATTAGTHSTCRHATKREWTWIYAGHSHACAHVCHKAACSLTHSSTKMRSTSGRRHRVLRNVWNISHVRSSGFTTSAWEAAAGQRDTERRGREVWKRREGEIWKGRDVEDQRERDVEKQRERHRKGERGGRAEGDIAVIGWGLGTWEAKCCSKTKI